MHSVNGPIIPAGPSLVRAAAVIPSAASALWPFPWVFPGPGSNPVFATGSVLSPAYGANPVTVVQYSVPQGVKFVCTHLLANFLGGGWNFGSGDLLFSLVQTDTPGNHDVDWYSNLTVPIGSFVQGPWPVTGRLEFDPLSDLAWTVETVQNVDIGAQCVAAIMGYTYPL